MLPTFADWPQDYPGLGVPGMRLRAMRGEDAADWYAYLRNEQATRHTSWRLDGEETLADLIRAYAQPGQSHSMRLAIAGPDDRLVGTIGLNAIALPQRRAEIAYDIAPAHWRQGLATKACAALTGWALETLGFARIQATVLDSNAASAGVLERCGFLGEGLLHAYRVVRGEPRHFWMYARTWPPETIGAECG
ncbi:Acetyltransferase (GNAT) domain protein [compost metagenome]